MKRYKIAPFRLFAMLAIMIVIPNFAEAEIFSDFVDAWSSTQPLGFEIPPERFQPSNERKGFDETVTDDFVPWYHTFYLPHGALVETAVLQLRARPLQPAIGEDGLLTEFVWLDGAWDDWDFENDSFRSQLTAQGVGNWGIVTLDLLAYGGADVLSDGRLNVIVVDDTEIDWSLLTGGYTLETVDVPAYGEWVYNPDTGYWYSWTNPGTWYEARAEAQAMGGELASIHSAAENQWIYDTFTRYAPDQSGMGCWLGFTDEELEGDWRWTDGSIVDYTNWYVGEPNDSGIEDHAHMLSSSPTSDDWQSCWNDWEYNGRNLPGIVKTTVIPEPASIILVGAAIAGLAALARKQMRKVKSTCGISFLLVASIFLFTVSHANALPVPHLEWIRTYDSPSHQSDAGRGVAVDAAGNVYVTGSENRDDLGQSHNIWLRKYNMDGDTLWTETYDSPSHHVDEGYGVAVDSAGDVYVTGREHRGDLGQDHNVWLRKYDTDGNTLWTETYDSPYHWWDEGRGVAVDSASNVYVTGREHRGDLDQDYNVWLRKYDTDGNTLWTETYDSPSHDWDLGTDVAVDSANNAYVIGFEVRNDLAQCYDIWLRKYDADGNEIWTQTYNSPSGPWEQGSGVTTDAMGNVYVVGHEFHSISPMWEPYDIWVRKYDPNGNTLWTDTYDSPYHGRDLGHGVAVDAGGNVYVTGSERRDDLGQLDNIWLRKYDTYGNILWTETYDSPTHGADRGYGLALDSDGNIYLAGQSDDDIILLKYSHSQPDIERISADTVGTAFDPDIGDGLGRITFSQETPIEIDWDNGITEVIEGGSILLWVDLQSDNSSGGIASGYFEDGEFAIWGDEGEELLTGEVDWLMMEELFDGMGIMGGAGRLTVTGGELMDSFGTMGEVVDITFNIDPQYIDDFGIAFTGESNLTIMPAVPEPASIILIGAALAGLAGFARKRLSMKSN